jgi:hypothetical protein
LARGCEWLLLASASHSSDTNPMVQLISRLTLTACMGRGCVIAPGAPKTQAPSSWLPATHGHAPRAGAALSALLPPACAAATRLRRSPECRNFFMSEGCAALLSTMFYG